MEFHASTLSLTVKTNWLPKTISPIIKKIDTRKKIKLFSKYLEMIVFGKLKIFDSIKLIIKYSS